MAGLLFCGKSYSGLLDEKLLKRYNCVLTLKNGSITKSSSFDELMAKKGYFYSLFNVSQ